MRTILLTGFEAFGTTPVNPAERVARHLDGESVGGAEVVSRVVPSTFFTCIRTVQDAIAAVCAHPQDTTDLIASRFQI